MKCAQATIAVPYSNSTRRGGGGVGGSEDVADSIFGDRDKSIFIATKQPSESLYMEHVCGNLCEIHTASFYTVRLSKSNIHS